MLVSEREWKRFFPSLYDNTSLGAEGGEGGEFLDYDIEQWLCSLPFTPERFQVVQS